MMYSNKQSKKPAKATPKQAIVIAVIKEKKNLPKRGQRTATNKGKK